MAYADTPIRGANMQWLAAQLGRFPLYDAAVANGFNDLPGTPDEPLTGMWYGGFPGTVIRVNGETPVFVQAIRQAAPGLNHHRTLFNAAYFTGPGGEYYDLKSQQYIDALVADGGKILWVLMSGPHQRQYAGTFGAPTVSARPEPGIDSRQGTVPGTLYWTHYYDRALIDADPVGTIPAVRAHLTQYLRDSWNALMNYLGNHPTVAAATIGFELINEPDTYREWEGLQNLTTALTYYVDDTLEIMDIIDAAGFTDKDIYIGGWAYSAHVNMMYTETLPAYGGRTPAQIWGDRLGGFKFGAGRAVWSVHLYPGWIDNQAGVFPTTTEELEKGMKARFGEPLYRDHRVAITEFNAQYIHGNNPDCDEEIIRKSVLLVRSLDFFRRYKISLWWWPLANLANGSIIDHRGKNFATAPIEGGFLADTQNAMMCALNVWTIDNNPEWFTGPDSGIRSATYIPCERGVFKAPTDPDYSLGAADPVPGIAIGFGGAGVAVVNPAANANNYLYGGNGRNVLYGGTARNFLSLGRGGGVARGVGTYDIFNTNGGNNLIYTGAVRSLVTAYLGQCTLVVNPAAQTVVLGWSPLKGDRLSFKGLVTPQQMRDGTTTYTEPGNLAGEVDVVINFPQGGSLRVIGWSVLTESLPSYVMDYTDGWYAPGWVEPADYTTDDFSLPIVPPSEPAYAYAPLDMNQVPILSFGPDWTEATPRNQWNPA